MSNLTNQQKATYALLADNVYWDVRNGFVTIDDFGTKDFTNSNWTPLPEGWTVLSWIRVCRAHQIKELLYFF